MYNKYLEEIGVKPERYDYKSWRKGKYTKKIKKETGLDFREVYNFDLSVAYYIYSRLQLFKEHTNTDLEYTSNKWGTFEGTLKEAIERVCKGLKLYIKDDTSDEKYNKKCAKYLGINYDDIDDPMEKAELPYKVYKEALHLFAEIASSIWD